MLFTPRLYSLSDNKERTLSAGSALAGRGVLVVPREDCAFRRITLQGKGRPALMAAEMQLLREAPSEDSRVHIVPDPVGQGAGAWTFDVPLGFEGRALPEGLLRRSPEDGVHVVACLNGYEGQVHQDGALVSTRWWPERPSEHDWRAFLRGTPAGESFLRDPVPQAALLPYRSDIAPFEANAESLQRLFSPMRLFAAGTVLSLCFMSVFGMRSLRYASELGQTLAALETTSETAKMTLSQRRRALRNLEAVRSAQGLGDKAQILTSLADVTAMLKDKGLTFMKLEAAGDRLECEFYGEAVDAGPDFVAALEAFPSLSDVNVSVLDANRLSIQAQMVPFADRPDSEGTP